MDAEVVVKFQSFDRFRQDRDSLDGRRFATNQESVSAMIARRRDQGRDEGATR